MKIGFDFVGVTTPFYCHDGKGNFLFHRRSKECRDEQGMWDPGSGKLDHGASLEENALKEVMEEYCCKGTIQEQLPAHDIFREQGGQKTHWIAVPFFVLVDPKQAKIGEPHKMDEIGWFRLDALPEPLHSGFQMTLSRFKDQFEKYKG